jgi:hypothetical protein
MPELRAPTNQACAGGGRRETDEGLALLLEAWSDSSGTVAVSPDSGSLISPARLPLRACRIAAAG